MQLPRTKQSMQYFQAWKPVALESNIFSWKAEIALLICRTHSVILIVFFLNSHKFWDLIYLHLIVDVDVALCFRFENFHVPRIARLNSTARLECSFDLDDEELFSVEWYNEQVGFYRREPRKI